MEERALQIGDIVLVKGISDHFYRARVVAILHATYEIFDWQNEVAVKRIGFLGLFTRMRAVQIRYCTLIKSEKSGSLKQ
jgi:hypothetical protein